MSARRLPSIFIGNSAPSPRYVGFWPLMQDATDGNTQLLDRSGTGNHLSLGPQATYSTVVGTSKYARIVSIAGANDRCLKLASASTLTWNMNGTTPQSLIVAMVVKAPAPGTTAIVWGNRSATLPTDGINLQSDTAGKPQIIIKDGATVYGSGAASATMCDDTDHMVVIMVDGTSKKLYGYMDGTVLSTMNGATITASAGSTQGDVPWTIGSNGDSVASSSGTWDTLLTSASLYVRHAHVLVMNSWPSNYLDIMREITKNPHRTLSADLLP